MRALPTFLPLALVLALFSPCSTLQANQQEGLSGRQIMDEVYRRHEQYPYVYEEQVMILIDRAGHRDTRKLRRFSRIDSKDQSQYLLLFDDPAEVRGVGLLTHQQVQGESQADIYLPAYGPQLINSIGQNEKGNFLGTDFSINDLLPESLDSYRYVRREDELFENTRYLVLDVFPAHSAKQTTHPLRSHYIRADIYFITRTDSYDQHGRLHKRQTRHDLQPLGGDLWRADMILMEDFKTQHQSLLKISRRVFSRDYVPEEMFSLQWLIENQRQIQQADQQPDTSSTESDKETLAANKIKTGGTP